MSEWVDPEKATYAVGFGERVNIAILASGLRKAEVARRLDVKPNLIQAWIAGRRLPSMPLFAKLCETIDVDAHWLLGLRRGLDTYSEVAHQMPEEARRATPERLDAIGDHFQQLAKDSWRQAEARRLQRSA